MKFVTELGRGLVEGALLAIILHTMGISLTAVQFTIVIVSMTAISGVFGSVAKALQKNKEK
jgi:hypothetical protein